MTKTVCDKCGADNGTATPTRVLYRTIVMKADLCKACRDEIFTGKFWTIEHGESEPTVGRNQRPGLKSDLPGDGDK